MSNETFLETLKSKLDKIRTKTLDQLLSQDEDYIQSCKRQGTAEESYLHLDLSPVQRTIIDNLLYWNDVSNMEYSSLNYLAGLLDSQKLLELFTDKNSTTDTNRAIRDFYNSVSIPVEKPYESP